MALYSSTLNNIIARNTSVYFYNNSALETGGAVYVSGQNIKPTLDPFLGNCFYQLMDYTFKDDNHNNTYQMKFEGNRAKKSGEHLFGVSLLGFCTAAHSNGGVRSSHEVLHFFTLDPGFNHSISAVSSEVTRVCICIGDYHPQCADNISNIFKFSVCPGEMFTLSLVVVSEDFGTTTGTVYAGFMPSDWPHAPSLKPEYQYAQTITNSMACTNLNYTLYSNQSQEQLFLTVEETTQNEAIEYYNAKGDLRDIADYHKNGGISDDLFVTPVFITIKLQPCPPGFTLMGDPQVVTATLC